MKFTGPRPACLALDGLMDELGDPIVELIGNLDLDQAEKDETLKAIENLFVEVFSHEGNTVPNLRDYIYELHREASK